MCFKENLRRFRKAKKLTQAELADIVKIDQRSVSAWETGIAEPEYATLAKLCDVFSCSYDELLGKRSPFNSKS